jgi:hypothetical protein
MVGYKTIDEMTVDEREAILLAVADTLEVSAREAILEGQKVFAENSQNIALAIRGSADELATEDLEEANLVLKQAMSMISQFRREHPHPVQSFSIH